MNASDSDIVINRKKDNFNKIKVKNKQLDNQRSEAIENVGCIIQPLQNFNNSINSSIWITNENSLINLLPSHNKICVLVYGNDIKIKSPFKLGKVYSCCYFYNMPLIIIGPQCNINIK